MKNFDKNIIKNATDFTESNLQPHMGAFRPYANALESVKSVASPCLLANELIGNVLFWFVPMLLT
jgi:hypothetical protein